VINASIILLTMHYELYKLNEPYETGTSKQELIRPRLGPDLLRVQAYNLRVHKCILPHASPFVNILL